MAIYKYGYAIVCVKNVVSVLLWLGKIMSQMQGSVLVCAAKGRGLFHVDLNSVTPGGKPAFVSTPFPAELRAPDVMSLSATGGSTVTLSSASATATFEVTAAGLGTASVVPTKGKIYETFKINNNMMKLGFAN